MSDHRSIDVFDSQSSNWQRRVTTVSVRTVEIVQAMRVAPRRG